MLVTITDLNGTNAPFRYRVTVKVGDVDQSTFGNNRRAVLQSALQHVTQGFINAHLVRKMFIPSAE